MKSGRVVLTWMFTCVSLVGCQSGQPEWNPGPIQTDNRPARVAWFQDLALGMFIHWSFDSQVGTVISHSMVGASDDYLDRFLSQVGTAIFLCRNVTEQMAGTTS